MIALIDADIVVYQAAAAAETTCDWGDDDITITGSKTETEDGIDSLVDDLKKATGAGRILMVFSDTEHFRKSVYPPYKSNRKGNRKPVTFAYGKAYVKKRYDSMTRENLEADDCLGIMATGDVAGFTAPRVVCSIDKDMRTFPCSLYNWRKPDDGVVEVTECEADLAFYIQCLTGDATDGYPGCPGIGPVRAAKILDGAKWPSEFWQRIVEAYEKKGFDENYALAQARCARILRASDYDFTTKRPILWLPPKGDRK